MYSDDRYVYVILITQVFLFKRLHKLFKNLHSLFALQSAKPPVHLNLSSEAHSIVALTNCRVHSDQGPHRTSVSSVQYVETLFQVHRISYLARLYLKVL